MVIKLRHIIASILLLIIVSVFFYQLTFSESYEISLPILMYHSVLKDSSKTGKYIIEPSVVEADIKYLNSNGYTSVSAKQIIDYVTNGTPLPEKPYLLTFDDGCYNNLTYIAPLLEKYNAYAVISIVGSYSENYSLTDEANPAYSYLRWKDINTLLNTGRIEIGNHSFDMHHIDSNNIGSKIRKFEDSKSYIARFSNDLEKTQELLFENCGLTCVIYTYPFGAICKEADEYLRENDFLMTFSCTEGINDITREKNCLYNMKRINRPGHISTYDFFKKHKIVT